MKKLHMPAVQLVLTSVLGVFLILVNSSSGDEKDPKAAPAKKKSSTRPFDVSKETTRITEPLRADGYIDYVRALNIRYSEGVTPDSNAEVLFVRAAGAGRCPTELIPRYLEMIGVDKLPEPNKSFVSFKDFVTQFPANVREQLNANQMTAMSRLWSKQDFPQVAAWLDKNEAPLALIVEGCRRPHYFTPMLPDGAEGSVISAVITQVDQLREFARALTCRAMLRAQAGDVQGAWDDLLACHQLARHGARGPTIVQQLVGVAITQVAGDATEALAYSEKLTFDQAMKALSELRKLPPRSDMSQAFDEGERFMFLDAVGLMTRDDKQALAALGVENNSAMAQSLNRLLLNAAVDWSKVLISSNEWYDRIVAAAREPDRKKRLAEFEKLSVELEKRLRSVSGSSFLKSLFSAPSPGAAVTDGITNMLVGILTPAFKAAAAADDRGSMSFKLTTFALALAAYHHERRSYPESLNDLKPRYLPEIPLDLFSQTPLKYNRMGQGYRLYSIGENEVDEGGRSFFDQPRGDDLTVRNSR